MTTTQLTDEQIDALSLDALRIRVAQAVGWTWNEDTVFQPGGGAWSRRPHADRADLFMSLIPDYPRDMAAVWELAEAKHISVFRIEYDEGGPWHAGVWLDDGYFGGSVIDGHFDPVAHGASAAEAICRCFLMVVNGTEAEDE